jgi:hypothetical protein
VLACPPYRSQVRLSALDVGGKFTSIDQVHFTNRHCCSRRGTWGLYFAFVQRAVLSGLNRPHISPRQSDDASLTEWVNIVSSIVLI